jgi:hypothetical protein
MARIGRFVVPELPQYATQDGHRRETLFFDGDDYALYRPRQPCQRAGAGYCLSI